MGIEFTKLSSKGQVVIPSDIRKKMGLKEGAPFAVVTSKDTILLKKIKMPTLEDFEKLTAKTAEIARRRAITKKDVEEAIREVRSKK